MISGSNNKKLCTEIRNLTWYCSYPDKKISNTTFYSRFYGRCDPKTKSLQLQKLMHDNIKHDIDPKISESALHKLQTISKSNDLSRKKNI